MHGWEMLPPGRSPTGLTTVHKGTYTVIRYEWDREKAAANRRKHRVSFADVLPVFGDGNALTMADPHPGEERYVTVGMDDFGRIVVVVYTWRGPRTIRLISARLATPRERNQYAEGEG
jgi:uncharacterized protein